LLSLAFLQSLSWPHLADSAAEAACQPLSWASIPFSTSEARGSTSHGFASPATFRLQGLATLLTVSSPRAHAGLVSCRQRSWDFALRSVPLPRGAPDVSTRSGPTCRSTCRCSLGRTLRPARQAPTSGLWPPQESLAAPDAINAVATGCSLGLWPLPRQPTARLTRAPTRVPLTRLAACSSADCSKPAPQSLDQRPAGPTSPPGPAKRRRPTAFLGFPHRFAPTVWIDGNPGYVFTSQETFHHWNTCPALWAPCRPYRSR
jgi:hypothetical protein